MPTMKSSGDLIASISTDLADNNAGLISAEDVRHNMEDVAFSIGPRLNAAGRLGQAQLGVELLTLDSEERGQALADYIDQLNKSRDSLDRKIVRAANKMIEEQFDPSNEAALVLAQADWHLGVIGIVAGRIAEKYHRPTILISIDKLNKKPAVVSFLL